MFTYVPNRRAQRTYLVRAAHLSRPSRGTVRRAFMGVVCLFNTLLFHFSSFKDEK